MTRSLDDRYLPWLYRQVAERFVGEQDPSRTHWSLFRQMHSIEFVWLIPNDDNRAEDGRQLRREWAEEMDISVDPTWLAVGCSFLEMLIALARRLAFEGDGDPHIWFWHLLDNLNLVRCTDRSRCDPREVEDIVNTVIWRTYDRNGRGGLFPLRRPRKDQRNVELWYQMNAYLLDG